MPLTNFAPGNRMGECAVLLKVLAAAKEPVSIEQLDRILADHDRDVVKGRATLAWMLKYGLLQVCPQCEVPRNPETSSGHGAAPLSDLV